MQVIYLKKREREREFADEGIAPPLDTTPPSVRIGVNYARWLISSFSAYQQIPARVI